MAPEASAIERAGAVYCRGPLLEAVQTARLFPDAKHFVDMPLRRDPEEILEAFEHMPEADRTNPEKLRAFVEEHFNPPDAELEPCELPNYPPEPPFLVAGILADRELQYFANALHRLWPTLCRKTRKEVAAAPHRFSALPREFPMVLPGGRFRETYYWDSLWIVQGLLASGLVDLARGLTQNLLQDVEDFGFVPNGGRIYYLNRSQPPVLCGMVVAIEREMTAAESKVWLPKTVATLKKEYDYWMSDKRGHVIEVGNFRLNRFNADWHGPRPESFWQDIETADGDESVYHQIATGAESGWDFSSRWTRRGSLANGGSEAFRLRDTETADVLPVDLNAFMFNIEVCMAELCEAVATGNRPQIEAKGECCPNPADYTDPDAIAFAEAAAMRKEAFRRLFWRPSLGRWADVWLPRHFGHGPLKERDVRAVDDAELHAPNCADFVPFCMGLASPEQANASVLALLSCGLLGSGGVASTTTVTEEQWDFPNGWAPLQAMLIDGLARLGTEAGEALALDLAQRWVGGCFAAWRTSGHMHEKYSATHFGHGGGGGEYEPQIGFGWSNGVVLRLLMTYGQHLVAPPVDGSPTSSDSSYGTGLL